MRVKLYQKMLEEWKTFELDKRVKEVKMTDLDGLKAIIEDSGMNVYVPLRKEDFNKSLQEGIKNIANKGVNFEGIELVGQNMRLVPRPRN